MQNKNTKSAGLKKNAINFVLLLIIVQQQVLVSGSAFGQTAASVAAQTPSSILDLLAISTQNPVGIQIWGLIVATFVSPVVTWVAASFRSARQGIELGRREVISALRPTPPRQGHKKNTILTIGLGRCGKSTLIKRLCNPGDTVLTSRTTEFRIHHSIHQNGDMPVDLYMTDYEGQDFSQLIANFVKSQTEPGFPMKYGDINTLLIVVDLFDEDQNDTAMHTHTYPKIDESRVDFHISQWNETALDAVFGLLTQEQMEFVCLFINKTDKWTQANGSDADKRIFSYYKPLIDTLSARASGYAQFATIAGSAHTGDGLMGQKGLLPKLLRYAVARV